MAENYICINGKRIELTEEQIKQIGIELPKVNPFEREWVEDYYYIDDEGFVLSANETFDNFGDGRFKIANYCTSKAIMEQRALHETLHRLLWRYSMEHGGQGSFTIAYDPEQDRFLTQNACFKYFEPSFGTVKTAENAIEEIIKPFMAAHPEFKW